MRFRVTLIGSSALLAALAIASGCSGGDEAKDLPAGGVAQVGTTVITRAELDRATVGAAAIRRSARAKPPYWASDVRGCVVTQRKRSVGEGMSDAELKQRCEQERDRAHAAALRLLIQGQWYEREARRRGISIATTDAIVRERSAHSGVRPAELAGVIRAYTARLLVLPKPPTTPPSFSSDEIASYYRSHRRRYLTSSQQLIEAVLTGDRAHAREMATGLRQGRSARALARRYEDEGVRLPFSDNLRSTLAENNAELEKLAGQLRRGGVGMVKEPRGWFVFKVVIDLPSRQQSLQEASSNVAQDLQARRQRALREKYDARLRAQYGDETVCADGYDIAECGS